MFVLSNKSVGKQNKMKCDGFIVSHFWEKPEPLC